MGILRSELYGSDLEWITDGEFIGEPARTFRPGPNRELSLTRGHQWLVPPINLKGGMNFFLEAPVDRDGTV